MNTREPFSLLMPVYYGDRPDFLRTAFRSAVDDQTRRPHQVVVVRDGPVPTDVAEGLEALVTHSPVPVTVVELENNGGLGLALDAGLAASDYDVVARMDSDDVSLPHRFERQLPLIEAGADIVGSGLLEFNSDPAEPVGRRTPPTEPDDIVRYSRFHDPFNHPTVVYRRSAVFAAGGYQDFPLMEDYWLFARMIANGARVVNVPEPLVCYRIGAGAYARRGGRALLCSELRLQRRFYEHGFTTRGQCIRNVIVRGGYRLVPEWLRRVAYRRVIATYGERRGRSRSRRRATSSSHVQAGEPPPPVRTVSRDPSNRGRSTENDALPER